MTIEEKRDWDVALENEILRLKTERKRQLEKWGLQDHDDGKWLKILVEEVGELATAMLNRDTSNILEEAIDVAAVAIAISQNITNKKA